MKKILLGLILSLALVSTAQAEPFQVGQFIKQLPPLKQGVAWSLTDNKLNYLSTMEVMNWKGLSFEAGTAGDADSTEWKAIGVLSYNILNLEKLGVTIPIIKLIDANIGVYVGFGGINTQRIMESETDMGISLSLITLKW